MNRKGKAFCLLFSVIFIITAFSGCNLNINSDNFVFSDGKGGQKTLTPEEIMNYTPTRPDAIGKYCKSFLSGNTLYIYNAVSYAVDNGCTEINIPEKYGYEDPAEYVKAITFYSCDSPFLEHNYTENGTFRLTESTVIGSTSYGFTLPRNSEEFSKEKQQAYEKAKEIVSNMPAQYVTDSQKMKYLYSYVAQNIRYATMVDYYNYSTVPIYDALVTDSHETICDGFADTLMMLFNIAGIQCFAVEGLNSKNTGHVAICAKLDGGYYYFDPTNDSNVCSSGFKPGFYYAISDKDLLSYFKEEPEFSDLLPVCPQSRISNLAEVIAFSDDDNAVNNAKSILQRDGAVNVYFDETASDSDKENFGRKLATAIGEGIVNTKANGIVGYSKQ